MQLAAKQPFSLNPKSIAPDGAQEAEAAFGRWLEGIKSQARENLKTGESIRVAWVNRFKVPRYQSPDAYTPEEILLELWEQFYFENPENIEMKGIQKRRNAKTGFSYYVTGDPLLDAMEEAFGRGEKPDMSILDGNGGGRDVFREPVFVHSEQVVGGVRAGTPVAPQMGLQGVQEMPDGAKITAGGAKVHHTDFSSDDWLKHKLDDDEALKALAAKLGGSSGK